MVPLIQRGGGLPYRRAKKRAVVAKSKTAVVRGRGSVPQLFIFLFYFSGRSFIFLLINTKPTIVTPLFGTGALERGGSI